MPGTVESGCRGSGLTSNASAHPMSGQKSPHILDKDRQAARPPPLLGRKKLESIVAGPRDRGRRQLTIPVRGELQLPSLQTRLSGRIQLKIDLVRSSRTPRGRPAYAQIERRRTVLVTRKRTSIAALQRTRPEPDVRITPFSRAGRLPVREVPEQAVFARLRTIKRRGERIAPLSSQQQRLTLFRRA